MEKIDIDKILEEYKPDNSLFTEEDEDINKLKNIIYSLTEPEKRIILLYAELGTFRKLGKELGVSTSSAYLKVLDIRNKIKSLC